MQLKMFKRQTVHKEYVTSQGLIYGLHSALNYTTLILHGV